jgi:hypothetical protein
LTFTRMLVVSESELMRTQCAMTIYDRSQVMFFSVTFFFSRYAFFYLGATESTASSFPPSRLPRHTGTGTAAFSSRSAVRSSKLKSPRPTRRGSSPICKASRREALSLLSSLFLHRSTDHRRSVSLFLIFLHCQRHCSL